jgi:hypothetical protein
MQQAWLGMPLLLSSRAAEVNAAAAAAVAPGLYLLHSAGTCTFKGGTEWHTHLSSSAHVGTHGMLLQTNPAWRADQPCFGKL